MEGPTRCPLCKKEEETLDHILLECPFSKEVWREAMMLNPGINLPCTIQDLLSEWMKLSPFHLSKKTLLQNAWRWIPNAICWKIWIERNNRIFREQELHPSKITIQARAILGEALDHNTSLKNTIQLLPEESQWLSKIVPNYHTRSMPNHANIADWEIRLDEPGFINWKYSLNELCLFFDGASKGNPGIAGGGGVFISANGTVASSYTWGLGIDSNNTFEL